MILSVDMKNYVLLSLPAFSALTSLIMYLYSAYTGANFRRDREVRASLTGYFLTTFFNWITLALFLYTPSFLAGAYPLRYASLLLTQVFFYRFIYIITRLPDDKPFSVWHYAPPVLLVVVSAGWWLLTPGWVPEQITTTWAKPVDEYPVFSRFIVSLFRMRLVYNIIYTTLSLKRIRRYRREVGHYTSQLRKSYMEWLDLLIALAVVLIVGSSIVTFIPDRMVVATKWSVIPITLLIMQHILILYNSLIRNFIILVDSPEESLSVQLNSVENNDLEKTLGKRRFEKFLTEKRPYTDKELRITDLAKQLNTNRTYLSIFINSTYGMNFSSLINERRLKYLEELRNSSAMKTKTNIELIHLAGFGSYQSYLRAKEKEAQRSVLKV